MSEKESKVFKFYKNMTKKCATLTEAKSIKNKGLIGMAVCIVLVILIILLGKIAPIIELLGALLIIPIVVVCVYFLLRFAKGNNEMLRLKNTHCGECETPFDIKDITYEMVGTHIRTSKNSNSNTLKVIKEMRVQFFCTCPKCGTKHSFSRPFTMSIEEQNELGTVLHSHSYNIEDDIVDYFSHSNG
ncbi:MAG: hypothetical protein IJX03_00855 [Clostridia bacterium]|nr:hypothetical protein [Clostridia bacterium]